jgi:RNA polymerase sigma-70 factor (ECF subfamily)
MLSLHVNDISMDVTLLLNRPYVVSRAKGDEMTLLEAAREMKKEALVEIFDLYSHAIYTYAYRLCRDPLMADHIVGDVFAKLLDQFSAGLGPNANLRSYLYETTYHLIVDQARYSDRVVSFELSESLLNDGYSVYHTLENKIIFEKIILAVRSKLTQDQRHVIILRFLEGFSLRETADIIGREVNYVKVLQNRAIATLRKSLDVQVVG